jgi:hypothetical protein
LPVALLPLWQVVHVPGATPLWSKRAPDQVEVRWQESHAAVVATCPAGFPTADAPLWQVAQVPGATPMWLKRAPWKDSVLWQLSHGCVVGMWVEGMRTLEMRDAAVWQATQRVGVPLNTPRWWQVSQRTLACAPVSGKLVAMWSVRSFRDGEAALAISVTITAVATRLSSATRKSSASRRVLGGIRMGNLIGGAPAGEWS